MSKHTQPMPLALALAALEQLHTVCVGMDHPNQDARPTEEEYLMAMSTAGQVLAAANQAKPPELLNDAEGCAIALSLAMTAYQRAAAFPPPAL